MAQSRLEKIGTIYTRITGLMRSGALKYEDRPLWYDVYEAFPPKEEPRFDRPAPNLPLRKIFYEEDKIRAIFHRNNKQIGAVNISGHSYKSLTQRFIESYKKIEEQYKGEATEEQIYKEAIELLNKSQDVARMRRAADAEDISLSSAFKEAQKKQEKAKVNIADIFKL